MGPDPFEVLRASLGPDARPVRLPDRTVVRTPGRPDDATGNAVHVPEALAGDDLVAALADAGRRFPDEATEPRVVVRATGGAADGDQAAWAGTPLRTGRFDVLVLDQPVAAPAGWDRRADLELRPPYDDDRAWHAVAVLARHAVLDASAGETPRGRGADDDLLRWRVEGRRTMVGLGRARAVLASRFGTPVAAGVLVWEPRVDVGPDHAGLAVVTDVVVHPAHRRIGVATTLVAQLLAVHLADFPRAAVATIAPRTLRPAAERRGWRVLDRLVEVTAG